MNKELNCKNKSYGERGEKKKIARMNNDKLNATDRHNTQQLNVIVLRNDRSYQRNMNNT